MKGHLDVLKWLRENGCPWNKETCFVAACNDRYDVLKCELETVSQAEWNEKEYSREYVKNKYIQNNKKRKIVEYIDS
jgi:hypothetical protein